MGRYDGPDFERDEMVSIWVAKVPLAEIPDDYFEERYGGEDDEPFNPFSTDFGFGVYDHDFVDTNLSETGPEPLEKLIGECSFSSSYLSAVLAKARGRGLCGAEFVILIYKFEYRPEETGITESPFLDFLGSFPYDSEARSAIL